MGLVTAMRRRLFERDRPPLAPHTITPGQWSYAGWSAERTDNRLCDIVALGADDIWVVGNQDSARPPLAAHWDGRQWRQFAVPGEGSLQRASASATNDVWAVSWNAGDDTVVHWDGSMWSQLDTDAAGGEVNLYDIQALGPTDVWAVGATMSGNQDARKTRPLVQHWDGSRWRTVDLPLAGVDVGAIFAVDASGTDDVWAVGAAAAEDADDGEPCCLHWDGKRWHRVDIPSGLPMSGESVTVLAADDIVISGSRIDRSSKGSWPTRPLFCRWNGTCWQELDPESRAPEGVVCKTAPDGDGGFWAAGFDGSGQMLFLHWRNGEWELAPIQESIAEIPACILGVANVPHTTDMWAVGHSLNDELRSFVVRYVPK